MDRDEMGCAAVRFIEAHLGEGITVAEVARHVHVSPYHFHRVFSALQGESVMAFVRRRRLERAAGELETTTRPIVEIALEAGFSSQATFTRAFASEFGTSPGRHRRHPARRAAPQSSRAPRITADGGMGMERLEVDGRHEFRGLIIEGLDSQADNARLIVALWEKFRSTTKGASLRRTYGICFPAEGTTGFAYMAATDAATAELPDTFAARALEAQTYAVFAHDERQGTIREAYRQIWAAGLAQSGRQHADGHADLEVYAGATIHQPGPMEIWIPVQ